MGLADWIPGESSVFTCDRLSDPSWMTLAIYVEDADDPLTDCLAVGADPAGLVAGAYDAVRFGAPPSFDLSACVAAAR